MMPNLLPFFFVIVAAVSACMPAIHDETVTTRAARAIETSLPPLKTFSAPQQSPSAASNQDIHRDFLDLAFSLESGRALPILTRIEGPITVRVLGSNTGTLSSDLNRLLHRLRSEAKIDITYTTDPAATITINPISRAEIHKFLPQAACFVVPNVSTLPEYIKARHTSLVAWSALKKREKIAIFVPNDTSPQEMRDCLHEELAQALGPLNDLYRLPDSVFNDDNVHTVLTGFDMLILRAYYDPQLQSGMSRRQVDAELPGILAQINPTGEGRTPRHLPRAPRAWINAIQSALGPGTSHVDRQRSAKLALHIATQLKWTDHRRGFSHYAMGRILQSVDSAAAQSQFTLAQRYFGDRSDTRLHQAYVASQLAAYAVSEGRAHDTLTLVTPHLDTAIRHENAALLSTLMLMRAEALDMSGRVSEGRQIRMDSIGWARYGFGSDWEVRAKMREISSLNPVKYRKLQ